MNINYNNQNGGLNGSPTNQYNNYGGYNQPQNSQFNNYGRYNQPQNNQFNNYGGYNQPQNNQYNNYSGYNQPQNNRYNNYSGYNQPQNNRYNSYAQPVQISKPLPQTVVQRKQLRNSSNTIGAAMILFLIVTTIIGTVLFMPILFSQAINSGGTVTTDDISPLLLYIVNAVISLVAEFAAAVLIIKVSHKRIDDCIRIKSTGIDTVKYVVAGMGFVFVFNLLLSFMNINLSAFGYENEMSDYGEITGIAGNIIYFIAIAVVPPIIEEFLFRGAILGSLRKHGDALAIIVSAIMFGFAHANFVQTPVTFLTGLVLGYLTVKTDSIIPAMILHFMNNAISVLCSQLYPLMNNDTLTDIIDISLMLVFLIAGLICTAMLIKKHGNSLLELEGKPLDNPSGFLMAKRLAYIFTSPFMIIFTLATIMLCFQAVAV